MKSTGATPFFTLGYIELVRIYKIFKYKKKVISTSSNKLFFKIFFS